jgi:DNA-binding NtrC family response regulator
MAKILLIDDEADLLMALTMILKSRGHDVTALADALAASQIIQKDQFDLIISDIRMRPMDGLQLLDVLHQHHVQTPVIMLTAYATLDVALQAIKKGAFDFITKPFKPDALLEMVQQVLEQPTIANGSDMFLDEATHSQWLWHGVVARSHQMQDVCTCLRQIAPTNETVLLAGEEGTGKRFLAEIIHSLSPRSKMTFRNLDCSLLNENEISSALFGSKPDSTGVFEKNPGGTILLENIDSLPPASGQKLAEFIQSKKISPANDPSAGIAARLLVSCRKTNESLRWIQPLAAFMISLPALRDRIQDLLPLISCLIRKHTDQASANAPWTISTDAYKMLAQYLWPRNVDELREMLDAAVASAKERKLTIKEFPSRLIPEATRATQSTAHSLKIEELRGKSFRDYVRRKQMEMKEKQSN